MWSKWYQIHSINPSLISITRNVWSFVVLVFFFCSCSCSSNCTFYDFYTNITFFSVHGGMCSKNVESNLENSIWFQHVTAFVWTAFLLHSGWWVDFEDICYQIEEPNLIKNSDKNIFIPWKLFLIDVFINVFCYFGCWCWIYWDLMSLFRSHKKKTEFKMWITTEFISEKHFRDTKVVW